MIGLGIREIEEAIKGKLLCGDDRCVAIGVSTDTRTMKPGDLFIALIGEHTDGHQFIPMAIEAGASGVVASNPSLIPVGTDVPIVMVRDTTLAFGDLAHYYRGLFNLKVIGITGSVGKTMTREMTASILATRFHVLKNEMNYNNEIGVPLTLLGIDKSHEVAVIEMAMRAKGEIQRLAEIAEPSIGVITNIGITHIERLGSREAIAQAKAELLRSLPSDGFAVLNSDDEFYHYLCDESPGKIVSFGLSDKADIVGTDLKPNERGHFEFMLNTPSGKARVRLPVMGIHSVRNALAASAAAYCIGIDPDRISAGLECFTQPPMRMQFITTNGGFSVISDCYNASPASMEAAIQSLDAMSGFDRKIAVLGDMLELGQYTMQSHYDIGRRLGSYKIDLLVAVGEFSREIERGANESGFPKSLINWCKNSSEAASLVRDIAQKDDLILVKGSRGMQMEKVVEALLNE